MIQNKDLDHRCVHCIFCFLVDITITVFPKIQFQKWFCTKQQKIVNVLALCNNTDFHVKDYPQSDFEAGF